MIVTFIFSIKGQKEKMYGKYIGQISDDYEEGLDHEILYIIRPLLEKHFGLNESDSITIGIISHHRDGYDYFSEKEKDIFDLLYCDWSNQRPDLFIHGVPVRCSDDK